MRSAHVLLVRPWDEQMSGSGCCGRLGGLSTEPDRADEVVARVLTVPRRDGVPV